MFWSLFDKSNQLVKGFYWLFHLQPQEVSQNHQIKYSSPGKGTGDCWLAAYHDLRVDSIDVLMLGSTFMSCSFIGLLFCSRSFQLTVGFMLLKTPIAPGFKVWPTVRATE